MKCSTRQLAALAIATLLCSGCGTGISDMGCPRVVPYDRAFQNRAADELQAMPAGAAVVVMMADYAAMRDQARACGGES
ncbi:MAG: hypothetical protein F9K32_16605 [Desulfobulbaceae bacterium]|nr:MAG: hypothetical protein F9K32_16605 [Desulfobulbaceae bacterium]